MQTNPISDEGVVPQQKYNPEPEFKAKLLDCCLEPKIACFACFLPGVVTGLNVHEVTDGNRSCCLYGFLSCCTCITMPYFMGIIASELRSNLRKHLGISGSRELDCLTYCFCLPCGLVQEYREVKYRKSQGYQYINAPGHDRDCECKRCTAPPVVQMQ